MASNTIVPDTNSDGMLSLVSFLFPLIGFIVGAILISKSSQANKITGGKCLRWAIIGLVVGSILTVIWITFPELFEIG
jgi:uncharacterized membrane protein